MFRLKVISHVQSIFENICLIDFSIPLYHKEPPAVGIISTLIGVFNNVRWFSGTEFIPFEFKMRKRSSNARFEMRCELVQSASSVLSEDDDGAGCSTTLLLSIPLEILLSINFCRIFLILFFWRCILTRTATGLGGLLRLAFRAIFKLISQFKETLNSIYFALKLYIHKQADTKYH